ncbi:MAG: hypothetical protein KA114_01925 [Bacteroidales bacterium]|nr:hypothetical protein [Bacteroidales bacterium]
MAYRFIRNKLVLPVNLISTQLISYSDINSEETDIYDDAWGFSSEFADVLNFLGTIDDEPPSTTTEKLLEIINKKL